VAISLSTIESKVRDLMGDFSKTGVDSFTYTNSNVFTLTEENVISVSTVYLNSAEMGTSETSFDSDTNKATVVLTMLSGDTVEIYYTYYSQYSSTEIQNYIKASLVHLSANILDTYRVVNSSIYPEPNLKTQNVIALITGLLIDPDNKSYRLPDVSIGVPKDLPLHEKIRRVVAMSKRNHHGLFFIS